LRFHSLDTLSVIKLKLRHCVSKTQASLLGFLITFVNNFQSNLVVMFLYFVNQSLVKACLIQITRYIIALLKSYQFYIFNWVGCQSAQVILAQVILAQTSHGFYVIKRLCPSFINIVIG
jgi:hypothetical protein